MVCGCVLLSNTSQHVSLAAYLRYTYRRWLPEGSSNMLFLFTLKLLISTCCCLLKIWWYSYDSLIEWHGIQSNSLMMSFIHCGWSDGFCCPGFALAFCVHLFVRRWGYGSIWRPNSIQNKLSLAFHYGDACCYATWKCLIWSYWLWISTVLSSLQY